MGFEYLHLTPYFLEIEGASSKKTLALSRLKSLELQDGIFWSQFKIEEFHKTAPIVLRGINKARAAHFRDCLHANQANLLDLQSLVKHYRKTVLSLGEWLSKGQRGDHWVANQTLETAIEQASRFMRIQSVPTHLLTDDELTDKCLQAIQYFLEAPSAFRIIANQSFRTAEMRRFETFFDQAEKNPLTQAQRFAVITHEDSTRVIAGAGSGKTSVMAVKAAYLLKKQLCRPDQLLLVAYNKNAAKELKERAERIIGLEVNATTFHALGLGIIGQVKQRRPSITKTAQDQEQVSSCLRNQIADLIKDDNLSALVRRYFQSFFIPQKSETEFRTLGDYYAYLNTVELRTIRNEKLRSFEEVEIANFLFINGISYIYEHPYKVDLANVSHSQYQPDFYLPDYDIYIEHFGIQRDGSTAPYIDREKYHSDIRWKRDMHSRYRTTLVETYSYMKEEGTLLKELQRKLFEQGVQFVPISSEKLLMELNKSKQIDTFTKLVATFLKHFKGNAFKMDEVRQKARERGYYNARLEAFLGIFEPIYEGYQQSLSSAGEIDFEDMISEAAEFVLNGQYQSPYTCILVDEFQDISVGRARLIKGLKNQSVTHRLFCVGDDWQAIYRFAGSDISLMRNFTEYFGYSESVFLDRTFRFNNRIEAAASGFIQKNPAQLSKQIACDSQVLLPRVIVHRPETKSDNVFFNALEEIHNAAGGHRCSVLVLGRYRFLFEDLPFSEAHSDYPNLRLEKSTVHQAKGAEADYVIILRVSSGQWGFPSEVTDDPLLNAVLSESEPYPHAEERRLFYVALTRARHAVHILADHARPSAFIAELAEYPDSVVYRGTASQTPVYCPECVTGTLVLQTGTYGRFYSCGNFPRCTYKAHTCQYCDRGVLVRDETHGVYVCSNAECGYTTHICPKCGKGYLIERSSRHGSFLGCSNFKAGGCRYIEDVRESPIKSLRSNWI